MLTICEHQQKDSQRGLTSDAIEVESKLLRRALRRAKPLPLRMAGAGYYTMRYRICTSKKTRDEVRAEA